jgi:hypothetical protein
MQRHLPRGVVSTVFVVRVIVAPDTGESLFASGGEHEGRGGESGRDERQIVRDIPDRDYEYAHD